MTTKPKLGRGASTSGERREVVEAICERIARGERLTDICRDDGMPLVPTFHAWVGRYAGLNALYDWAKAEARTAPVRTHMAERRLYSGDLGRMFCDRLSVARTMKEVCAQADMPCEMTVYRWCREEPEFADWFRAARECQAHQKFDLAWEIAEHRCWSGVSGARLAIDTLRWQVAKLAPEHYGSPKEMAGSQEPPIINVKVVRFGRPKSERDSALSQGNSAHDDT